MAADAAVFRKLFPKRYIPLILSSIFEAGETLQKETPYYHENRLTTRLCNRLSRIPVFRDGPLGLHPQQDIIPPDTDTDRPSGKIDILIDCDRGFHVYFAIEAKRLRTTSRKGAFEAGNSKYVNDGMMRFITGQYAPLMESSAMLGYVYDGDIQKARSGINAYIKTKKKELKLKAPAELTKSKILSNKCVDETNHDLSKRQFVIYHLLIAV